MAASRDDAPSHEGARRPAGKIEAGLREAIEFARTPEVRLSKVTGEFGFHMAGERGSVVRVKIEVDGRPPTKGELRAAGRVILEGAALAGVPLPPEESHG